VNTGCSLAELSEACCGPIGVVLPMMMMMMMIKAAEFVKIDELTYQFCVD
jgi:hypothetical protein